MQWQKLLWTSDSYTAPVVSFALSVSISQKKMANCCMPQILTVPAMPSVSILLSTVESLLLISSRTTERLVVADSLVVLAGLLQKNESDTRSAKLCYKNQLIQCFNLGKFFSNTNMWELLEKKIPREELKGHA